MAVVYLSSKKLQKYAFKHDPQDEKYYTFVWKVPVWSPSQEYSLDTIIRPAVPNGFYYICTNPGISGASPPDFPSIIGKTVAEIPGLLTWEAVAYNINLTPADTVTVSDFHSLAPEVIISDESETDGITSCKVGIVGVIENFVLTNRVTITRQNGNIETLERSILVSVSEL
jgi:hypothetical protein